MATRDRHYLEIVVDSSKASRQLRNIDRNLGKVRQSAQGIEAQFRRFNSVFSLFAGAGGAGLIIKSLTQMIDGFNETASRLRLVTENTVGYQQALDDVAGVALSTMTDLNGTITLYSRLAVATQDAGISHQDLLGVTEATALSLRLSGASAKESAAFMTQFSQALSSGRLSGDEFRSMLESNVVMTQALARSLKTTVGGLREMSKEGELINSRILPALLNNLDEFREKAARLPVTVSRGVTNMISGFTRLAAAIDKAAEATTGLGTGFAAWGVIFNRWAENIEFAVDRPNRLRGLVDNFEKQEGLLKQLVDRRNEYIRLGLEGSDRWIALEERLERQFERTAVAASKLYSVALQRREAAVEFPQEAAGEAMGGIIDDIMTGRPSPDQGGRRRGPDMVQQTLAQDSAIWDAWLEQQAKVQQSIDLSTDGFEEHIKKNEELGRATMDLVDPNAALVREMESLDKQLRAGVITADVWLERQLQIAEQMENNLGPAVEDAEKNLDSLSVALGQTMANAVDRLGDTMVDFAFGTKTSFSDMANSILKDIASMMVKFALMRIMFGGQTPGAAGNQGGLLSFLFNANGNAFSGGNVVPFARGGVVSRPTMFPMANGGVGVMGERSPEAVMPLMRDSKGRLGVSGGGTVINIHNNTSGEVEQNITNGPDGSEIVDIVIGQVDARIMAGGSTARAMETAYGVKRAGYNR